MKSGDYAWIGMGAAILTYEVIADDLLSDAVARWRKKHPLIVYMFITGLAAHLNGVLPFTILLQLKAKIRRKRIPA